MQKAHPPLHAMDALRLFVSRKFGLLVLIASYRSRFLVVVDVEFDVAVLGHARSGRDKLSDDDVLLQAQQRINLSLDGRFGQHACGFLEGRGGQEGFGGQRGLCDTEQRPFTRCGTQALLFRTKVLGFKLEHVNHGTRQHVGVTRLVDFHLAEHLPDDDLDVLVVDVNALEAVHLLDLLKQVVLDSQNALDLQDVLRVDGAFRQLITRFDCLPVRHLDGGAVWDEIGAGIRNVVASDDNFPLFLGFLDLYGTGNFGDDGQTLWLSRLEQFLDAGKTLGDVITGNTTGMEGTHCQLGARLADGLGGNEADRLADVARLAKRQVDAVTFGADADFGTAGQRGPDDDGLQTGILNLFGGCLMDQVTGLDQEFSRSRVDHVSGCIPSGEALGHILDDLAAGHDRPDTDALCGAAVFVAHDDILGDVHQTTGEVSRVGRTKRGVGQTLSGTVRGDEVLQNVQPLTEVRTNWNLNRFTRGVGHQAAHAGQLADLVDVASGTGIRHHVHRIELVQ
jgi:hypothetical protein